MTERSAENYMNAARWIEGKSEKISDLPAAAIYALAAPTAPAGVVNDVVAAVENGAKLRVQDIKSRIAEAIEGERKAKIEAAKTLEQKKKEHKARQSRAAREAKKQRELGALKEREGQEEQERRDRLTPIAQHLVQTMRPELPEFCEALRRWDETRTLLALLREMAS